MGGEPTGEEPIAFEGEEKLALSGGQLPEATVTSSSTEDCCRSAYFRFA